MTLAERLACPLAQFSCRSQMGLCMKKWRCHDGATIGPDGLSVRRVPTCHLGLQPVVVRGRRARCACRRCCDWRECRGTGDVGIFHAALFLLQA